MKRERKEKKEENINDYCTAHEAAEILAQKHGRPVRADYISKMAKSQKHRIRTMWFRDRQMYHRRDVAACTLGSQKVAVAV
jgi:hypothetical protein